MGSGVNTWNGSGYKLYSTVCCDNKIVRINKNNKFENNILDSVVPPVKRQTKI